MNKEEFNQSIDDIPVPLELLKHREKTALFSAKKKTRQRNMGKYSGLVASILFILLLGTGFLSPAFAQTLSKIPYLGPIYAQFNDMAATNIKQEDLATMVKRQDEHNGITMAVKEAVYDGGRLIVTVEYKGDSYLNFGDTEKSGFVYLTINGKEPEKAIGSTNSQSLDANTIIESHQFTLKQFDEYGDTIDVAVHGENLYGIKGKWNVSFPLKKLEDKPIQTFTPNVEKQTDDELYTLKVKQVLFSSLSTRIDLDFDYPEEMDEKDTYPWFDFVVTDDEGNVYENLKLQSGQIGKFGHQLVIAIPPFDNIPKSLTIQSFDYKEIGNGKSKRYEIKDLSLKVPIK